MGRRVLDAARSAVTPANAACGVFLRTNVNKPRVQVRCACRRQKGKMRCAEARALAAARSLPAPVEGVAVALLHCDAKCRARAQVWPCT